MSYGGYQEQDTEPGNPHISRIEAEWDRILPLLNSKDGRRAADHLRNIREDTPRIYNALYWRIDKWMKNKLSTRALTVGEEGFDKVEIGSPRLAAFLQGRKSGDWWNTYDLAQILGQIDEWSG